MRGKAQQRRFVKDLCADIERKVLQQIAENKVPACWDGIELREYVADVAERYRARDCMTRSRLKEYRNTIIINNL